MLQRFSFFLFAQRDIRSLIFLIGILSVFEASATLESNNALLQKIQIKYDSGALTRIKQWHTLIQTAKHLPEKEKLKKVNNFFNQQINYVSDIDLWGINDYWATPKEILVRGAGDCEDYSIAKYFSLIQLGVPEKKLRITYVKTLKDKQAHMVLAYFSSPFAKPSILDNLIPEIRPINRRKDLIPLFNFNDSGLWLVDSRNSGKKLGDSIQLAKWTELKKRL